MKPRHLFAAALAVGETPILAILATGWLVTGLMWQAEKLVRALSGTTVYGRALRTRGARSAAFIPPAVAVGGLVVARLALTPTINAKFPTDFGLFFSTGALGIATLLIALALQTAVFSEVRTPSSPSTTFASQWGFLFVGLGEIAAVLGLSTRLPAEAYRWAFSVTVAAGLAVLTAVVMVGWRNVAAGVRERDRKQLREWADAGDEAAQDLLKQMGYSAHQSTPNSKP